LGASAVFDPVRDRMVVFGGYEDAPNGTPRNDVYALSLSGAPAWSTLSVSGSWPSPQGDADAVYDPLRDRMVLIAGTSAWGLSFGTTSWEFIATATAALQFGPTVYDSRRDRVLTLAATQQSTCKLWALDLASAQWDSIGATELPYRGHPGWILDPVRDRLTLFGGENYFESSDTWECPLSHPGWVNVGIGDPPLWEHYFAWWTIVDANRNRMITMLDAANIFALDLHTWQWTRLAPTGTPPPFLTRNTAARYVLGRSHAPQADAGHEVPAVLGDAIDDRAVIFASNRVWELHLSDPPRWEEIFPSGQPPPARDGASAIIDTLGKRMIIFGGTRTSDNVALNDTWALSLTGSPAWSPIVPVGPLPPPSSGSAQAVYDEALNRMVVFGDSVRVLTLGDSPSWRAVGGSKYVWLFYDDARHRVIGVSSADFYGPYYYWAFDLLSYQWNELHPSGIAPRPGAKAAWPIALAFDPLGQQLVHFGQTSVTGLGMPTQTNHTWRWIFPDSVTSIDLTLVSADVNAASVRLRWYAARPLSATVQRRTADADWLAIGEAYADGGRSLAFEDHDVVQGTRYGYRLAFLDAGVQTFAAETWLEVPRAAVPPAAAFAFALDGFVPNPAAHDVQVSFTLPTAGEGRLEVFDAAGRRFLSRSLEGLAPGRHLMRLGHQDLASGLYIIRLSQGGRTVTKRAAVLR
jgi:hypothetical protein